MAMLHISQLIRTEGFERIISRCDRITILGDYPTDASMIAPNSYGHTDLTSANFERSTSSDDEIVITVKGIPAIDVLLDDLDLKYIALHSKSNLSYWMVFSVKSTAFNKDDGVALPDFTFSLKLNDSEQHVSPDLIWKGYADLSTKCGRVMLCAGVPKSRAEVSSMHLGEKNLTAADFEQVGSGDDSRMMLKEQRMPPATKAGSVLSVALLESGTTDNFAVSRISNPIDIGQGGIVDVNGVGFKIEQGAGSDNDPRIKPHGEIKLDPANPITRELLYYTLDFKTEMVHNYDMPHEGADITWDATTRNVSFNSTATSTHHNIIKLGTELDDGNLLGQAITVAFKFRQPNDTGTLGTVFCNSDDNYDGVTALDMLNGASETRGMHYWTWWAGKGLDNKIADSITAGWHSYVLTRGDDADNDMGMYVDGSVVQHTTNCPVRKHTNQVMRIGGYKDHPRWKSFLGELEYFAVWKRKLTDAEIATFSEKPYEILINKEKVDKPTGYQTLDITKRFAENLIYYTQSWVDDLASNRPIYPESKGGVKKAFIDPVTQNLLFDANFDQSQMVDYRGGDKLSTDNFTISIRLKLSSTARAKTLDHAIWGFRSASSTNHVGAKITGTEAEGYKIIFSIGRYIVTADVAWNLLSNLKTWSFTYNSNDRIIIYRNSTKMVEKDIRGRRASLIGGIRVGYNMPPMEKAFPGEIEYLAVWNETFNSVHLHDFLQFPYAHLKPGILQDIKPVGKGTLDTNQTITDDLTTYVFDAENEVVRNRTLNIHGEGGVSTNTAFTGRQTKFDIQIVKQGGLSRYETRCCILGYRPANDPAEPNVDNRTVSIRVKLSPKPPNAPADVVPHHSTLFCCAIDRAEKHQRWHVYYYAFAPNEHKIAFEYGDMSVVCPFALDKALNFHNFVFRLEQARDKRTLSIWIDGEQVASNTQTNEYDVYNLQWRLGGYQNVLTSAAYYLRFKGVVDSYGIWKRALTEDEIKKLHREPYVAVNPNLKEKPDPNTYNISLASSDLTRKLFFYTLDFKNELVNNYWMEKVGANIRYIYSSSNVRFESNINDNRIFLMPPKPGYDYQPKFDITILWRARNISDAEAWQGNYFCNPSRRGDRQRMSSHVCRPIGNEMDLIIDPGLITTKRLRGTFPNDGNKQAFFTMALRVTYLGPQQWKYEAFARGQQIAEGVHTDQLPLFPDWRFAIGGWERTDNYKGAKMEMEYFAFWARALSDDELAYVTENPYALVEIAPKENINPTITVVDPGEDDAD